MYEELTGSGVSEKFGRALHEGWMRKRSLASSITNDFINGRYESALAAGAVGGKLLGAGGGGFLLFYCDERKQAAVEQAVGLPRVDFQISQQGSRVICCE